MEISLNDWRKFKNRLAALSQSASDDMLKFIQKNGGYANIPRKQLIDYAYGLATKYGEASASLAAEMYDTVATLSKAGVPAAEVAETAEYGEVAKAINGVTKKLTTDNAVSAVPARLAKRAGADTTLKNAKRDGAQFAWIPVGDTCAFCLTLASRGWQYMSKDAMKNGHAEHIHANCDCTYAVRFDDKTVVKGYDPEEYRRMYDEAEGRTPEEKINSMRRIQYEKNKDKINEQKRANYEEKNKKVLAQHKRGDKVYITDQAIDKIKKVGASSCSPEELQLIQELNKEVLRVAKNYNDSNEVAIALVNGELSKPVLGEKEKVNIYADSDMYHILKGRDSKMRSVTLSHNHPGLSYFSVHDLGFFVENPSIETMEVVTNQGKVWYLTKKDNYDDLKVLEIYKSTIKEYKDDAEKAVDTFVNRIYNVQKMIDKN